MHSGTLHWGIIVRKLQKWSIGAAMDMLNVHLHSVAHSMESN
jgi:hypothetical protein